MIQYINPSQLPDLLSDGTQHILAVVEYEKQGVLPASDLGLAISIHMPHVGDSCLLEIWTSPNPVSTYRDKEIQIAFDDDIMLGSVEIEEKPGVTLEEATRAAYRQIFNSISNMGYVHLARMWNYFPSINGEENGRERYQGFCMGRHAAFAELKEEFETLLPAASAVGTDSGLLHIDFVAAKNKVLHVENPRQISAYHYPKRYGPRSPSFARGTVCALYGKTYFFVAGTASIVGHATQHLDDPQEQTKEAILNIEALIDYVKKDHEDVIAHDLTLEGLKVYIRSSKDDECVQSTVEAHFGKEVATLYLRGDMCRKELLVEIEAIFSETKNFGRLLN